MIEWLQNLFITIGFGPVIDVAAAHGTITQWVAALMAVVGRAYLAFAVTMKLPKLITKLPVPMQYVAFWIMDRGRNMAVAIDMLACSVVFLPWSMPRETVSGLFGRWQNTGNLLQRIIGNVGGVALHLFDRDHCMKAYAKEFAMRSSENLNATNQYPEVFGE
jgi:hypothetical protein